ncbi:hypothetical protein PybrP1_009598, partial [[Pythium] brassicae (nom. inval.)]
MADDVAAALRHAMRSAGAGQDAELRATQRWMQHAHASFYAPTSRRVAGTKFFVLETALTQALTEELSGSPTEELEAGDAQAPRDPTAPTAVGAHGKNIKRASQPYTPLAFILVNALTNLTTSPPHASGWALCTRGGAGSKFLALEAALTAALARRVSRAFASDAPSEQQLEESTNQSAEAEPADDELALVVRALLVLSQESGTARAKRTAARSANANAKAAARDANANIALTGAHNATKRADKRASQPYTPLAFILVNALTNLTLCTRGLEDPSAVDQKLLVELLDLFQVAHFSAEQVTRAGDHLMAARNFAALLKLCGTFAAHVAWDFRAMVRAIARAKDWASAELMVRAFEREGDGKPLSKCIVEVAIELQELKRAHRLVHNLGLQQAFPDIDMMYSRDGLTKLIEKQRWQIAITFVGSDAALQQTLLEHMLAAGEFQHARVVAQRLGLANFDPAAAQAALQLVAWGGGGGVRAGAGAAGSVGSSMVDAFSQSVHAAALRGFLELPLSADAVVFCDSEDDVRSAMRHFFGGGDDADGNSGVSGADSDSADGVGEGGDGVAWDDRLKAESCDRRNASNDTGSRATSEQTSDTCGIRGVVGLDVEWKPTTSKIAAATGSITTTAVASILQIASSRRVFLIDLLALHWKLLLLRNNDFLFDEFLLRLFRSRALLKVGFGFDSDLKVLHQTFPERAVFRSVAPFLELSSMVLKTLDASAGKSLSDATNRILGRPLDKRMQMSDWDERPLSPEQMQYAALDAFCL